MKFIELPIYEFPFRRACNITKQVINTDYIIRIYPASDHEFENETFIELTRQYNKDEPIRTSLSYQEVFKTLIGYGRR